MGNYIKAVKSTSETTKREILKRELDWDGYADQWDNIVNTFTP